MRGLKTVSGVILITLVAMSCVAQAGNAREAAKGGVVAPDNVQLAASDPVEAKAERPQPLSARELDLRRLTKSRWE